MTEHRVESFEEVVLATLERSLVALQRTTTQPDVDDALIRDLESGRDGSMRHIAQTIRASQYAIIRAPLDQLLVVQGGPGTGKAAVALHRVSYWLYNAREEMTPDDVLVVGPSKAFVGYISSVLPGLGDRPVRYRHLRELGPQPSDRRAEPPEVTRIKGEARMASVLARGLDQQIRAPEPDRPFRVSARTASITIRPSAMRAEVDRLRTLPYRVGRAGLRSWIANRGADVLDAPAVDAAVERVWPQQSPQAFLSRFLGSRRLLEAAASGTLSDAEISCLHRPPTDRLSRETWSDADVALLDEVDSLMGSRGIQTHRLVVVDEAQDLSPMQVRSLRRRSAGGAMTLVGDIAQSTGLFARDSWDDIVEALRSDLPATTATLEIGFRVPKQVFDRAAPLLHLAAPAVPAPTAIRPGPSEPRFLHCPATSLPQVAAAEAARHAAAGAFVGVICPADLRGRLAAAMTEAGVDWVHAEDQLSPGRVNLVRPSAAKGLEFDAVVVIEPGLIVDTDPHGLRLLYIALTRTTAHLSVVYSRVDQTRRSPTGPAHGAAQGPGPIPAPPRPAASQDDPSR